MPVPPKADTQESLLKENESISATNASSIIGLLWTEQGARLLWASEELSQDWMYQKSMDSMHHAWMQEKYDAVRKQFEKRECSK